MKICVFGNLQSIHLQRWVNYFKENNHDVHVITFNSIELDNVKVYEISFLIKDVKTLKSIGFIIRFYRWFYRTLYLKRLIDKIQPDIINAHFLTDYGILTTKLNRHPIVLTCWGSDILINPFKFGQKHKKEIKKALKKADLIHSVSEQITNQIKKLGINENKIITNPIGTNIKLFDNQSNIQMPMEIDDWGVKNIIISTRQFEPVYNQETIIKAIPNVIIEEPDVRFLFLGDGKELNEAKMLVKNLKMEKYVRFIGKVQYERIFEFLKQSKIYISSSLSDGTSISLLEAMANGVFPIVTNIPANRSWITHGKNGFLFEKEDYENLSELILQIINNKEMIKNAIKINQEIIKERGDWKKNMELLEKSFRELTK